MFGIDESIEITDKDIYSYLQNVKNVFGIEIRQVLFFSIH